MVEEEKLSEEGLTPTPEEMTTPEARSQQPLYYWGTGRRKTAVSRVRLRPNGSGQVQVNRKRNLTEYFPRLQDQQTAMRPLDHVGMRERFDIFVNVRGGGYCGQAGATQLGVARALVKVDPTLYPKLKEAGFLTRDAREKERKKYGQRGARARFQFSKR